jgi:hypothetical protein
MALLAGASLGHAAGIDSRKNNQIIIYAETLEQQPTFWLVFSKSPLHELTENSNNLILQKDLQKIGQSKTALILKLGEKSATAKNRFDYFIGSIRDQDKSWNNGTQFEPARWQHYDDDIWDNISVIYYSTSEKSSLLLTDFVVRRSGVTLYDSRIKHTFLNKNPVDFKFKPQMLEKSLDGFKIADFSSAMKIFRNDFYELQQNPLLNDAFSDLAQTDHKKYTKISDGWCSEFVAYIYRKQGYALPDPNSKEINWFILKSSMEKTGGTIYPLKEMHNWTEAEKIQRIKPGSIVSIVTGGGTSHTLLFTQWNKLEQYSSFSAISGNNNSMVWPHHKIKLPLPTEWNFKNDKDQDSWSRRSYIAVPP